jgi:cellulose synthase/poly-beta-1,6-N-acetylglucosamine synthase-like glycosyltransferase
MDAALILLGLALLGLALHPFTTYPLSLALLARLRPRPVAEGPPPPGAVALCVSAYNEERVIAAKVENMLAMRRTVPALEILVYVDAATDRTAEILRGFGDAIRLVVGPARRGKTHGMNTLVAATRAEFVVFSDANVRFAADALPRLLAPFADAQVGCVCGHLLYTSAAGGATAATGALYWRIEERIKALESRTGSAMGADGSIFAIRRALHRPPPADIIDDMYVSLAILCAGRRVVRADAALAYEETVSRPAEEFRRKIRIACQAFNVHRLLRAELSALPALDRYKYVSHKLLRWMAAFLLAGAGLSLFAGLALAEAWRTMLFLAGDAAALAVFAWLRPSGPVGRLGEVAGAFLATGIGVLRSIRGERFQTWTPPASARGAAP